MEPTGAASASVAAEHQEATSGAEAAENVADMPVLEGYVMKRSTGMLWARWSRRFVRVSKGQIDWRRAAGDAVALGSLKLGDAALGTIDVSQRLLRITGGTGERVKLHIDTCEAMQTWRRALERELGCPIPPHGARLGVGARVMDALLATSRRLRVWEATCEVCCETVLVTRLERNACGHVACGRCWERFLAASESVVLARMRHSKDASAVSCYACTAPLDAALFRRHASPRLHSCAADLRARRELVRRAPDGCKVVDCPRAGCVGVGYETDAADTAMCFLCLEQWEKPSFGVLSSALRWLRSWWPDLDVAAITRSGLVGWRPCPHCGAAILRDGGCEMMRCTMCAGSFRWGKRGNTMHGLVEAHAPPASGREPVARPVCPPAAVDRSTTAAILRYFP